MEVKFDQFLTHSKAQAVAMDELRSMFKSIVEKGKLLDEGSPSMTESALENLQQQTSKPRKAAGKEKQQVPSTTAKKDAGRTTRKVAREDLSNSNDAIPCVSELEPNFVQEVQERIRQGPSESDVADPTMEAPRTENPSQDPPTSTTELDITLFATAVQELPPSRTEENVEVVAAEGVGKQPKTPDSGGLLGDSNSADGGPAAQDEKDNEVSAGKEDDSQASFPTAPLNAAEGAPPLGSPVQRRCRRQPIAKSPQQVIPPPDVGQDCAPSLQLIIVCN